MNVVSDEGALGPPLSRSPEPATRVPVPTLLWTIALAGVAAAALVVTLTLTSDQVSEPGVQATLDSWMTLTYVLGGVVAWWHRPDSRFGPLMIAAGFANALSSLGYSSIDPVFTIGHALDLLPPVLFIHVFLAYPSGRLERPLDRALVITGYVAAIGLQLVQMTLGGFGPHNLLELGTAPTVAEAAFRVQLSTISALALAGIGILAARRRRVGRPLRRWLALLIDSFAIALVMIAFLLMSIVFGAHGLLTIQRVTFFVVGLAPIAFLLGLLDARLARSAVGGLLVELRGEPAPANLRDALARALRDPSVTLAYWLPQFGTYADLEGRPVALPGGTRRKAMTLIDREGVRVAALLHDPSLHDEPELLDSVVAAAGIALENARLHAELRARLEELKGSRARVIEAGQSERQRLERNLHDGAQQRLVALSLELGLLAGRLDADPEASGRLTHARSEIALSLGELRDVARGLHPAVVSGHGLAVALESLIALAPLPVRLTVALEGRLPEALEVAAYYVVSESLTNIGKHAHATSGAVDVARSGGRLVVEVVDDGVGGADTEGGSGLRGLADRVEALGGRLQVWTPLGGGTRVRAELPCG
jgi:signal transduction histidine kinase